MDMLFKLSLSYLGYHYKALAFKGARMCVEETTHVRCRKLKKRNFIVLPVSVHAHDQPHKKKRCRKLKKKLPSSLTTRNALAE